MVSTLIALVVGIWALSYHRFEFKGGLAVRDSGFFSYPRYSAEVGQVPLWKDGNYQFTVRGLPPGPLDFVLQLPDTSDADKAQLASSSTRLRASIADSSGKTICSAAGKLADVRRRDLDTWILNSLGSTASLWQPQCKQLPISRFRTYLIEVIISDADERSPRKIIVPILEGGGNELP